MHTLENMHVCYLFDTSITVSSMTAGYEVAYKCQALNMMCLGRCSMPHEQMLTSVCLFSALWMPKCPGRTSSCSSPVPYQTYWCKLTRKYSYTARYGKYQHVLLVSDAICTKGFTLQYFLSISYSNSYQHDSIIQPFLLLRRMSKYNPGK